ncbi:MULTISPECIES: cupredoxin domain-containing protein [Streptomyces]|uniref:Cupredoxin domain-containing protein n=1 Tax=Streptomyces nondiastaticus TaxID=3154512 RepID=A0ABW6U3I8_9ACTN|nr:cupredoxin domain-containing protein [Streptomyces sp. VNUA116]WKU42790.1 cupredoxin domain-containing protein [Streptomyces sp. VNUA116]
MSTQHTVLIRNFTFAPNDLVINAGDSVAWTNQDSITHTATSDASPPVWDTGDILPGRTSSPITFQTLGTFPYHCRIHPDMRASIMVVVSGG